MFLNGHIGLILLSAGVLVAKGPDARDISASPFYTIAQRNGAWWFLDPAGEPFLSLGVNVVRPGVDADHYNPSKPQYASYRYYADDNAWARNVDIRLRTWNFNTIGGWHDERFRENKWPRMEVLHLGAEAGVPWIDVFDKSFEEHMNSLAAQRVAPFREDAQLVGWFTDNELGWYADSLFAHFLSQPAENKTRQQLVRLLKDHYQDDFAKLTQDFVAPTTVHSFDDLAHTGSLNLRPGARGSQVVADFVEVLADRYYGVVCKAIRKHDPNHLILGDRYPGYCPDAVVRAAGRHLDVISTNYDWPRGVDGYLPQCYLQRLHDLSGKPVIVTEYYSAAAENQSDNPNSGELFIVTPNQASRAQVVRQRLQQFADTPYVVGAHWFAFADEPPHGRPSDGEDYNFGLVDIHDRPYDLLTAGMQKWHADAAPRHNKSSVQRDDAVGDGLRVAPLADGHGIEEIDATLNSQTVVPTSDHGSLAELAASWNGANLYLTIAGNHFVESMMYVDQTIPLGEGQTWNVTVAHGGQTAEFQLQMLGEHSTLATPSIEHRHWQRGVRRRATAAVPAELLGIDSWKAGDVVAINAELCDRREDCRTTWNTELKLSAERSRESPTVETASLAP